MNQPPICWCSRVFQEEKVGGTCALLPRLKSWLDKKRVPLMAAVQGGNICTSSHCLFTRSIFFSTWGFLLASNHKLVIKFSTMQWKVKIQSMKFLFCSLFLILISETGYLWKAGLYFCSICSKFLLNSPSMGFHSVFHQYIYSSNIAGVLVDVHYLHLVPLALWLQMSRWPIFIKDLAQKWPEKLPRKV